MSDFTSNILSGNDYSGADASPVVPANVPMATNPDPGIAPDLGDTGTQNSVPPQMGPSNQPASPQTQAQQINTNVPISWRDVLRGALVGMSGASQVRGRGSFAGGLVGGAGAELADQQQQFVNKQAQQRQAADIKFQSIQAAHMAAETTMLAKQVATFDKDHQQAYFDRETQRAKDITEMTGQQPEYVTTNDSDSEMVALKDATAKNGGVAPYISIQTGPNQFLHFNAPQMVQNGGALNVVNDMQKRLGQPVFQTTPGKPGSPQEAAQIDQASKTASRWNVTSNPDALQNMKNDLAQIQNLPADTYKRAESIATLNKSIATSEKLVQNKKDTDNQDAADKAKSNAMATGTYQKNIAEANKANADAASKNNTDSDYLPKATQDQKKKADLADNIAENAAQIKSILARRPDLVGVVNGRISQGKELSGTNDADLTALDTSVGNLAKANASVHGLRSHEGIVATEKSILNSFKNGPQGIGGALDATTNSVQTFVDAARPQSSPKHSSNGGVKGFYEKQTQPQGGPKLGDTKTFPNGNVGVWDGKGYVQQPKGQ
jgi:hypothetical protein